MEKNKRKKVNARAQARVGGVPMNIEPAKIRLVISCTEQERAQIRVLSAMENKTITDYLLEKPRKKMAELSESSGLKFPNAETKKVFKDTDEGINLESHETLQDFWKSMGMNPLAKD